MNLFSRLDSGPIFLKTVFCPLRLCSFPLTLLEGERNDYQRQDAVTEKQHLEPLHAQERKLRLILVVSGALHSERNFSSSKP